MTVAAAVEPERLLFVDECGLHTSLAPIYGYAPRGEGILEKKPQASAVFYHSFSRTYRKIHWEFIALCLNGSAGKRIGKRGVLG